jgi:hypothetical protein
MNRIKWKTVEKICVVAGPILALVAILYSYRTDCKLEEIQYRGNAPFFIIKTVQLDVVSWQGGEKPYYQYCDKPSELLGDLANIDGWNPQFPDDYPDNYPVGLLLENIGSQLRTFSVKCEDKIIFREVLHKERFYELRYIYQKSNVGKPLRFTIEYETYEGIQGSHTWETVIGKKLLSRVKPNTTYKKWLFF